MHELGIVTHIIKTLEDVIKENNLFKVGSVTLEVGEVSAIIPEQLLDCWDYMSNKKEAFKGCKLNLENLEAITFCENCKQTYKTIKYGKTCPYCQSEETYLVSGNGCSIKEIEAE